LSVVRAFDGHDCFVRNVHREGLLNVFAGDSMLAVQADGERAKRAAHGEAGTAAIGCRTSSMSETRLQIDVFVSDKLRKTGAWTSAQNIVNEVFLAEESIERALGRLFERGHIERNDERPRRYRWRASETNVSLGFSRRPATGSSWREEIETNFAFVDGSNVVLYVYDDRVTDGGQAALRVGEDAVMDALRKLRREDIFFDAGELYGAVTDVVLRELGEVCASIVSTSETVLA
jgi:hypothetical protein